MFWLLLKCLLVRTQTERPLRDVIRRIVPVQLYILGFFRSFFGDDNGGGGFTLGMNTTFGFFTTGFLCFMTPFSSHGRWLWFIQ